MTRKPLIAVTTRLELTTDRFYLGRHYLEALSALGAVPVLVPLIPQSEYLRDLLERCDGLLLPGSDSDVNPQLYGEEPRPGVGTTVPEKDATDLACLAIAEDLKLPVLGICFGMQSLNVARGGTLRQDIPAEVPGALKHQQGRPYERNSHLVEVDGESSLARLITTQGVLANGFAGGVLGVPTDGFSETIRKHTEDGQDEAMSEAVTKANRGDSQSARLSDDAARGTRQASAEPIPATDLQQGMDTISRAAAGSVLQRSAQDQYPSDDSIYKSLAERKDEEARREPSGISSEGLVSEPPLILVNVNSHHHQAVKVAGRHLRVAARAADGVIEAIEDDRPDRFVLGVQWHPELSWSTDRLSHALFTQFVAACGRYRSK